MARHEQATDRELMRLVQAADDTEAFAVLYDRLAPAAVQLARRICLDSDRAQDAVQDGFLSIWRGRAGYEPDRGEVHTWMFEIVRNRAIDSWRRTDRHDSRRSGTETAAEQLPAPGDVETDAVAHEDARRLHVLLADLPAAQREVITLAYFGQLSHTEISDALELPLGTVKGRMRLGLTTLRAHLT